MAEDRIQLPVSYPWDNNNDLEELFGYENERYQEEREAVESNDDDGENEEV